MDQTILPIPIRRLGYRAAHGVLRAYWFLARPQTQGVKCVLTDADRVLLVRHTYGRRRWDLPGGMVRRREPPSDTATREMHEELGVEVERWRDLGTIGTRLHHKHDTLYCFQSEIDPTTLTIDRGEIAAAEWFTLRELPLDISRYMRVVLAGLDGVTKSSDQPAGR